MQSDEILSTFDRYVAKCLKFSNQSDVSDGLRCYWSIRHHLFPEEQIALTFSRTDVETGHDPQHFYELAALVRKDLEERIKDKAYV